MRRPIRVSLTVCLILAGLLSSGCPKATSLEGALNKGIVALRAARKITATQRMYGHLTFTQYQERLRLLKLLAITTGEAADTFADLTAVTPDNKVALLLRVNAVLSNVDDLLKNADLGVISPESQAEYRTQLLLIQFIAQAIYTAIDQIRQPTRMEEVRVQTRS